MDQSSTIVVTMSFEKSQSDQFWAFALFNYNRRRQLHQLAQRRKYAPENYLRQDVVPKRVSEALMKNF
jgi:hypothetical protein